MPAFSDWSTIHWRIARSSYLSSRPIFLSSSHPTSLAQPNPLCPWLWCRFLRLNWLLWSSLCLGLYLYRLCHSLVVSKIIWSIDLYKISNLEGRGIFKFFKTFLGMYTVSRMPLTFDCWNDVPVQIEGIMFVDFLSNNFFCCFNLFNAIPFSAL